MYLVKHTEPTAVAAAAATIRDTALLTTTNEHHSSLPYRDKWNDVTAAEW